MTLAAAVGALLFISASLTVEIFYLKDVVGASDAAYALLVCGWMAGHGLGATALARRVPARLVAAAALVALAVQGAGMGLQTAWAILPVAFAGYLVGGVGHGVKNVLLRALIAVRVPAAVHGRAFAAYNAARNTAELGARGRRRRARRRARPARRAAARGPRPDPGRGGGADRAAATGRGAAARAGRLRLETCGQVGQRG